LGGGILKKRGGILNSVERMVIRKERRRKTARERTGEKREKREGGKSRSNEKHKVFQRDFTTEHKHA
jgi:hypothetical protein